MTEDFWADEPEPIEREYWGRRTKIRSVKRDSYDQTEWAMLLGNTPAVRQNVADLELDFPTSPPAYEDLYHLLFRNSPAFEDEREMVDDYRPQWHLLASTETSDDFQFLRKFTTYDAYYTTQALLDLADPLRKAFEEMQRALEDSAPFCPWPPEGGAGQPGDEGDDIDVEAPGAALAALVHAMHKTADELEAEQELIEAYGVEDGELKHMSFDERRALTRELSQNKLGALAKLLGQWRPFANAERRRKVVHAPGEVVGYTVGNDLTALAPEEFTNLVVPELEDLFWVRYARRELWIEKTRGFERAGQGPIIVVCDESQSMESAVDNHGNTREMWSKALSLALSDQARRDGRDFIYIGFSSQNQVWSTKFVNGKGSLAQVKDFVTHFFNGGTHFERPLRQAMDVVTGYERAGKPKPDILFITDGACSVPEGFVDEWRKMRVSADVRCYGVQIGGSPNSTMNNLVDRAISLSRLNADPAGMADLFRTI